MRIGWRIGVVGLLAGLAAAVLLAGQSRIAETVSAPRGWAEARGVAGMIGFGAAYVALALLFVPGAVLTMRSEERRVGE